MLAEPRLAERKLAGPRLVDLKLVEPTIVEIRFVKPRLAEHLVHKTPSYCFLRAKLVAS